MINKVDENIIKKKCIGCKKIMPEYIYQNNRIECVECSEKRLSIYKFKVPIYLKLIKKKINLIKFE